LFTPKPFVKQTVPAVSPASAVDDELQKKLESRRQSILAAQKRQEERLQQRALQKQLAEQTHIYATLPHIYENNCNANYENVNLQIDIKSFNSEIGNGSFLTNDCLILSITCIFSPTNCIVITII
jgi:hypothetical protein